MGFTGKRAMEFKIRYIEAFNRMEEELRRQREHPRPLEDPETLLRRKREQDRIRQARHRAKLAEIRKSIPQDRFPEDCGYLELNFPEQTAKPSRPFWKDLPDNPGSLSIQDLLDPDYPDPIRQVLECLEKAGYDVQGPWTQYQAMKEHLRSCAEVFTEIYELVRGRRRDRWPL
jgi:hypothetical protein